MLAGEKYEQNRAGAESSFMVKTKFIAARAFSLLSFDPKFPRFINGAF